MRDTFTQLAADVEQKLNTLRQEERALRNAEAQVVACKESLGLARNRLDEAKAKLFKTFPELEPKTPEPEPLRQGPGQVVTVEVDDDTPPEFRETPY